MSNTGVILLLVCGTALWAQQKNFEETEAALLRAVKQAERIDPPDLRLADALYQVGSFYRAAARATSAERFYLRSLSVREQILGVNHPTLAEPLTSLVALYLESRMYGKAARLHDRVTVLAGSATLAVPDSAALLHQLASLYFLQHKYEPANQLLRQALATLDKEPALHGSDRAAVLNSLAMVSGHAGRKKEAVVLLEQALVLWERTLSPGHPNVARALTNLAGLYVTQSRYSEAEPLFQRARTIAETSLGPENLLVATILQEYASLLRKTERKKEAKELEQRARAVRENQQNQHLGRHTVDISDLLPK